MRDFSGGSSRDIVLGAEVGVPTGKSGPKKSSADTESPLSQRSRGLTPVGSRSIHATICLARLRTMSSGGGITGFGESAGEDPPARNPSGGRQIYGFRGYRLFLCWH